MPNHQSIYACLILALTLSLLSPAQSQNSAGSSETDERFMKELDALYKDNGDLARLTQFSRYRREKAKEGKSFQIIAREEEEQGRKIAACCDYLLAARDAISERKDESYLPLIEKVVEISKTLDPSVKRLLIDALMDCAANSRAHRVDKGPAGSEALLQAALAIKDSMRDNDDQLISILMDLASIQQGSQRKSQAAETYRRALGLIQENSLSDEKNEQRLMTCVNALSILYKNQGDFAGSESLLKGVISSMEATHPADKRMISVPYLLQLQSGYRQRGKVNDVALLTDKIVAIIDIEINKALDKTQSNFAVSIADQIRSNSMYHRSDADENSERLLKAAFKLKVKARGVGYWIASDLGTLALLLQKEGKSDEALELYRKTISAAKLGADQQAIDSLNQGYLTFLRMENRLEERAKIEKEIRERQAAKEKETELENLARLEEARKNEKADPKALISALVSSGRALMNSKKKKESIELLKEAMDRLEKLPPETFDETIINQLWDIARNYVSRMDDDDSFAWVNEIATLEEKRKVSSKNYYYADVQGLKYELLQKKRSEDAESFLQHLVAVRKHYRPKDLLSIIDAEKQLLSLYEESDSKQMKIPELNMELIRLLEEKYGASDSRTLFERTRLASYYARQSKFDLLEQSLKKIFALILESETEGSKLVQSKSKQSAATSANQAELTTPAGGNTSKPTSQSRDYRNLSSGLNRIATIYIRHRDFRAAEKIVRKIVEINPDDRYMTKIITDRILKGYAESGDFSQSIELLSYFVEKKRSHFGEDSLEAANERLSLSEAYFKLSRQLGMQGKRVQAKDWSDKSEAEYKRALASIEKSQGAASFAAREAIRRREQLIKPTFPNIQAGDEVT